MTALEPRTPSPVPLADDKAEVVIIGAGLSGLFTALKLAPMSVTVISAAPFGKGTSSGWAQGGIAAAVAEGDTPEAHLADTIRAGAGLVDEPMARLLAEDAPDRIADLLEFGVPFDKDLEGKLKLSREAAHGARRIVRVKGDLAGKAIMSAITDAALKAPSIRILEGYGTHELVVEDGRAVGVNLWPTGALGRGAPVHLPARAVVLATGGIGQLYEVTTNPRGTRGDGIAMAARAGAVIADAEFVQFHPTALDVGRDPAPLATEALRGEGAKLINGQGERFMAQAHADAELAPRDVVARAVFREVEAGRRVYLDCREAVGARFPDMFPNVHGACVEAGIDPITEPLPVVPAAHYHMGGVLTDAYGRTTVDGLWACGEVAATGAHGANRLASNSLLETVVFGARTAEDIAGLLPFQRARPRLTIATCAAETTLDDAEVEARIRHVRQIMSRHVGVIRNSEGLALALNELGHVERNTTMPLAVRNMALAATFIAAAALKREESRGAHFRSDYPETRPAFAERQFLTRAEAEAVATDSSAQDRAQEHVVQAAVSS